MRFLFSIIGIVLCANFLIDLLDSDMTQIIKDRTETKQRSIDEM